MPDGKTYYTLRDGLQNARIRFERERAGRVAFLGGSITQADGWRVLVGESLARRFPETAFDFVNAGFSSTDSSLGAMRLRTDVLHRGRVDLLFVEFAVNDNHNERKPPERVRGMEGVIHQARTHNPGIDIVMLGCWNVETDLRRAELGLPREEWADHLKVAEHYAVTTIDFAEEGMDRLKAGITDFGGLHPSPAGHRMYADSIGRLFDAAWGKPISKDDRVTPHPMPAAPLDPLSYVRGRYIDIGEARIVSGWRRIAPWAGDGGDTRSQTSNVPVLAATEPGATLTLPFTGTAIGLFDVAGPQVGVIEFSIDGGPVRTRDLYTVWSGGLHIPWLHMLDADLAPGPHTLTLRISGTKDYNAPGKAAATRGTSAFIVKFVAN